MNVNKTDIISFLEERKKYLNKKLEELKEKADKEKTMLFNFEYMEIKNRLTECIYIKEMISTIWNIIHQKKKDRDNIK